MQFPSHLNKLILRPKSKQYMEFNITTKDFKIYDDQIHLASNLDNSFFFHRYYGNYCDTAWFSGSYQTANRRFGGNYEKNIGLGIDYEESKVSWYLNGVLQYSDTLQGWSNNAKQNNEFDQYVYINFSTIKPFPDINIVSEEMKYPIPDGYVSVSEISGDYKIYNEIKNLYSY